MYFYKLRRKAGGKFSTGTTCPRWTSTGKVWHRKQDIKNHLNYFLKGEHYPNSEGGLCVSRHTKRDPNDYEVVHYCIETCQTKPVSKFMESK